MSLSISTAVAELEDLTAQVHACLQEDMRRHGVNMPEHLRLVADSYLQHPGKYVRPKLLLLSCAAAGGDAVAAVPAAAAMEMFHTWTLLHDDVIDHDQLRRGRPTGHMQGAELGKQSWALAPEAAADYGQSLAILSGDLLQARAMHLLLSVTAQEPAFVLALAKRHCVKLTLELLAGEQIDVQLSHTPWEKVQEKTVLEMMRLKTGALLSFCAETGVALAEKTYPEDSRNAQQMAKFAECCGLAFQIQDDILGICGDEKILGKPIGSDIREGKRTLVALNALQEYDGTQKEMLLRTLGNDQATEAEVEQVKQLLLNSNSMAKAQKLAEEYVGQARQLLHESMPDNQWRKILENWAEAMTDRQK